MLNAIHVTKDVIVSGGSDFKIRLTSRANLSQICAVDISSYAPNTFNGVIKAISVSEDGEKLAVGLHASEIIEITCKKYELYWEYHFNKVVNSLRVLTARRRQKRWYRVTTPRPEKP